MRSNYVRDKSADRRSTIARGNDEYIKTSTLTMTRTSTPHWKSGSISFAFRILRVTSLPLVKTYRHVPLNHFLQVLDNSYAYWRSDPILTVSFAENFWLRSTFVWETMNHLSCCSCIQRLYRGRNAALMGIYCSRWLNLLSIFGFSLEFHLTRLHSTVEAGDIRPHGRLLQGQA